MGTIASLLGQIGESQPRPWDIAQRSTNEAQTGLITLADLKAKQRAEQEFLLSVQNDPRVREALFGGSVLGSIGPAGAPEGMPQPGPITQSPLGGGPAQQIPAYPDASRFAGVSPQGGGPLPAGVGMPTVTPPQSTIAALGPAEQPPMQAPRNPLLEMAQRDPRAAMMMQQQLEGRQDAAMKRQEQHLKLGAATLAYVGQQAQGVTDQASLDALRSDLQNQGLGKYAAQLPQFYANGAMAPFIARATDVEKSLTLQIEEGKAQAALLKARREQANIPNYTGDAQLDAIIYTKMKDQPAGTMPSQEIVEAAVQQRERNKLNVSERQGVQAAEIERTEKPLEGVAGKDAANLKLLRTMTDDIAALRTDAFTGPIVGRTGYLREQAGKMDQQETAFRSTLQNMKDILGRLRSGANIPAPEMANLERLLPTVNDQPETFKAKMQSFQRALEQQLDSITSVGTTGRERLREETKPTTPRVGEKPTSQGSTGTGKPVSQMSADETRAEIAAIKARGGK